MDYSEVLLGLRQAIACGKISQRDLNLITKFPEAREALRDAFGSLNAEQINRSLNNAFMSVTQDAEGQHQLVITTPSGFPLVMTLPRAELQSSPEPTVSPEYSRYPDRYVTGEPSELLQASPIHEHDRPLPPFDPSVERIAPARPDEALSDAIASGKVEVSRESVPIEEVIAKIEKLEKEIIDEHRSNR